jgi:hypothetical protein
MRLSYRGIPYENEASTVRVTEGEIGGLYRGQNWRYQYVRHIPQPQPVQNLRYRGAAYRTGQPTPAEATAIAQSATTVVPRTLPTRKQPQVLEEITVSHQRNIQRSLEHRLNVARAKGDETLVRLLEAESRQLTLPLR